MNTVTRISTRRRLDNPANPLGRVFLVLRDASYWQDLDEIQASIEARFDEGDSTSMILERIAELIDRGEEVETRIGMGVGVGHREFRLAAGWDGAA